MPAWDPKDDFANGELAEVDELRQEINKRLTLNLLIQGAASHAFLTAHHLVKDELEAIRPGLTRLYDRMTISGHLSYWIGDGPMLYGRPGKFWRRTHRKKHPFHRHRLLAEHGRELSRAAKRYLTSRSWQKRVVPVPGIHYVQLLGLMGRVACAERGHKQRLTQLVKQSASLIWGIDESRLDAAFTTEVVFGHQPRPKTFIGRLTQSAAIGYGGVERREGQFAVVAKAWNWPLVLHELVKGTAELVCLHGLNALDDAMYAAVTAEADQIEYEVWMLQTGPELWRRLLAAMPSGRPLPEILMHIARLDPQPLERLMLAVVQDRDQARRLLKRL